MTTLLVLLGVGAGVLTTISGMGGGILLLLALSLLIGPHAALATTAPALLVSNAHRLYLFRKSLNRRVAALFALGALPGSLAGGAVAAWVSPGWVKGAMVATTLLALGQRAGWWKARPPAALVAPAGAVIGAVAATAGGAGTLVAPVLMAAGLSGDAYVAGTAAAGVSMHTGRVLAYGFTGLVNPTTAAWSALLVVALLVGNALGQRLRAATSPRALERVEIATLLACAALALAGAA